MRLFIAVDLPAETRKELEKSMKEFHPFLEGSWVRPENLHLTVRFLGEADQKTAEKVIENLSEIETVRFEATLSGLGVFPTTQFIRVFWAGAGPTEKFREIRSLVDKRLEGLPLENDRKFPLLMGGQKRFQQQFHPHITLVRVRAVRDREEFLQNLEKRIQGKFLVDRIVLKKSVLGRSGPVYEDIGCFNFSETY